MKAAHPGMTTLIGVAMRRVGCEVSEVSSLTSQRPQLRGCCGGGGFRGLGF